MSRDIADKVYWGWVDSKGNITVKPFYMLEPIRAKEREITTRGVFEPFAATCIEEASEMCFERYLIQQEQDQIKKETQQ